MKYNEITKFSKLVKRKIEYKVTECMSKIDNSSEAGFG